jgi:HD-GYP domain-containing protein (c-di-GMP phosphodiesterase class II)
MNGPPPGSPSLNQAQADQAPPSGLLWWTERARALVLGPGGWRAVAGPSVFAVLGVALLVYDHYHQRVGEAVFWLTLALIVTVFLRMLETIRRQSDVLLLERMSKLSDQVTGLQTGRQLKADIRAALATPGERLVLVLLELDGLQAYNDRFGYAAGDEVLRRFAQGLVDTVVPLGGNAYRSDGSRLAALVPAGERQLGEIVLAVTASLREHDGDAVIGHCYGDVAIPEEAVDAELAFRIASQRLAAHKKRQHRSARRQAHAVLKAVLVARDPEAANHLRVVAYRAISLARRLGVGSEEIDDIALAAELQKIGMLAVPEQVRDSAVPLDEAAAAMVRNHTVEGERIIGAAPGLAAVAVLVRSSSEHFDGSGGPDGLTGETIPLGARIIAVSVAFSAMISPRPYRPSMSVEDAFAELLRCAGTQFDPKVVNALAADLAEEAVPAAPVHA